MPLVHRVLYPTPIMSLKEYLTRHNIPFENRDVSTDENAVAELQRMNAPGVPVVRVGDEVIVGFDQARLEEALKAHGPST